jgi:hypothetical protein
MVANTIAVGVELLSGVGRECVELIRSAVVVVVKVEVITEPVTVRVNPFTEYE